MYYIYKGNKKVDSFYLNDYPFNSIHKLNKKPSEKNLEVDSLGYFERFTPSKMFPIRKNSCIWFATESEAINYINNAKLSILNDNRFSLINKDIIVKYLESFTVSF